MPNLFFNLIAKLLITRAKQTISAISARHSQKLTAIFSGRNALQAQR